MLLRRVVTRCQRDLILRKGRKRKRRGKKRKEKKNVNILFSRAVWDVLNTEIYGYNTTLFATSVGKARRSSLDGQVWKLPGFRSILNSRRDKKQQRSLLLLFFFLFFFFFFFFFFFEKRFKVIQSRAPFVFFPTIGEEFVNPPPLPTPLRRKRFCTFTSSSFGYKGMLCANSAK